MTCLWQFSTIHATLHPPSTLFYQKSTLLHFSTHLSHYSAFSPTLSSTSPSSIHTFSLLHLSFKSIARSSTFLSFSTYFSPPPHVQCPKMIFIFSNPYSHQNPSWIDERRIANTNTNICRKIARQCIIGQWAMHHPKLPNVSPLCPAPHPPLANLCIESLLFCK